MKKKPAKKTAPKKVTVKGLIAAKKAAGKANTKAAAKKAKAKAKTKKVAKPVEAAPVAAAAPEPVAEPAVETVEDCVCTVCGSTNVQYPVWYSPNTGETGELFGSWNNGDNQFCADCDMEGRDPNPNLMHKSEDVERFEKLRDIRLKLDAGANFDDVAHGATSDDGSDDDSDDDSDAAEPAVPADELPDEPEPVAPGDVMEDSDASGE